MQLDSKTYFQLYDIIAPAISSVKTMIRPITFQLVQIDDEPLEMSQGFSIHGVMEKLKISWKYR